MRLINIFLLLLFGCAINARRGGSQNNPPNSQHGHGHEGPSSEECISEILPPDENCDKNATYRTIDGRCNNLKKPLYGAARTPLLRILDHNDIYIECPNQSDNTENYVNDLPTAIEVSNALFDMKNDEPNDLVETTSLFTYFGQFLDHDITLTENEELHCETESYACDQEECFVAPRCPMYEQRQPNNTSPRQCFPFTRSKRSCNSGNERKLMNSITSFIDGSQIYGSSEDVSRSLRTNQSGQLTMQEGPFGDILPENPDSNHPCVDTVNRGGCFLAGDIRVNEHIALTSLHTLFAREHNKIAEQISNHSEYQGWNDDKIFLVARKIVGAIIQRIVYKEYLTKLLLDEHVDTLNHVEYSEEVNPSIFLEFNTAAFRFGHSQVKPTFKIKHKDLPVEDVSLRSTFFNTNVVRNSGITAILTGLVDDSSEVVDTNFAEALGEHLFIPEDDPHGKQNLAALNIQRGRDHRLAGYKHYLEKYLKNLKKKPHKNYESFVPQSTRDIYNDLYRGHNGKIDLFSAGLKEISFAAQLKEIGFESNILGPTFEGIIKDQFESLKKGDRFFYTNYFTPDAIDEIETIHLSSIFCRNLNIDSIQKYVFENQHDENPERSCDDLKIEYNITCLVTEIAPPSHHDHQNGHHGNHHGGNTHDTYHEELRYHPRKDSN